MCDTLVALGPATASGAVLFGKNSDREFDEAQCLEQIPAAWHPSDSKLRLTYRTIAQVRQTHAVLLSKPYWIWGAEMGANEHGLVIGNEAIFSRVEASLEPGVIGMDYVRLALERATDVDEGIAVITDLLREYGQSGQAGFKHRLAYHNSYLLADPGGASVLETVDREWVTRRVTGFEALSNVITIEEEGDARSPTLAKRVADAGLLSAGQKLRFKSAVEDQPRVVSGTYRRGRLLELLQAKRGALGEIDFFRFLRDHLEGPPIEGRPGGPRICMHHQDSPLGHTTGSWVATLGSNSAVHWVTGTAAPCTSLFKPLTVTEVIPDSGPGPAGTEDASSLWWRHEQLRRLLDTAVESDRQEYMAERDRLESSFLERVASWEKNKDERQSVIDGCWADAQAFENRWRERLNC